MIITYNRKYIAAYRDNRAPTKSVNHPCHLVDQGSFLHGRALIHLSCTGQILDLVDGD